VICVAIGAVTVLYIWDVGGEHTLKILTFYGKYGNVRIFFMAKCVIEGERGLAAGTCAPTHVGDTSLDLASILFLFSFHHLFSFLHFSQHKDKKISHISNKFNVFNRAVNLTIFLKVLKSLYLKSSPMTSKLI